MTPLKLDLILSRLVRYSFYALFFVVPLIMTPWNYELFEFNKMVTVYFLTILITSAWLARMVLQRRIIFQRTFLDLPLLLFFVFNFLSFVFSIDRHTSLLGYYSRFNGGLLSIICYLLLYYAFVANMNRKNSLFSILYSLFSATLVAIYGILQHFGIDKDVWVQDVQNRVFSTLGQPNWLATYIVGLAPLTWGFAFLNSKFQIPNDKLKLKIPNFIYYLLSIIYYLCLLYTKSRSGLLGFAVSSLIFWGFLFLKEKKKILKPFLILNFSFLILAIAIGTPWTLSIRNFQFSIRLWRTNFQTRPSFFTTESAESAAEGGTESGEIRRIVWSGAWSVFKSNPVLGTGPETFAYSYYWFRPVEHNLTSEWDFLYNKAHNEYLNLLACTGILGLESYLFIVGMFTSWLLKMMKAAPKQIKADSRSNSVLGLPFSLPSSVFSYPSSVIIALLAGYWGLLVSNFFGFSVVATNLLFFLFSSIAFVLVQKEKRSSGKLAPNISISQYLSIFIIALITCYLLHVTVKYWLADYHYAQARGLNKTGQYSEAKNKFEAALRLNPWEPFIQVEAADNLAQLAQISEDQEEVDNYQQKAKDLIQKAIEISPYNLNNLKIAARAYYRLSDIDEESLLEAFKILKTAATLAPTDAKVFYNLSLLYGQIGETRLAIETLQKTLRMKKDYYDAWYALSLFYEEINEKDKTIQALENLLKWYPEDEKAKEKLGELKK